jgi:hypothetical protein
VDVPPSQNDDEFPITLGPFLKQFENYDRTAIPQTDGNPLAFLRDWETPMHKDTLEQLTEPGAKDAESFGKQLGDIYSNLLPEDHNEAFRYGSRILWALRPTAPH